MYPLSPICEETVNPHIGRRVCAVMHDGTRHYGLLRGIGDGKLFLEDDGGLTLAGLPSGKKRTKNVKAQTNAFFGRPYGYPYGYPFGFGFAAGFGIGLIASLFLLPFFFI